MTVDKSSPLDVPPWYDMAEAVVKTLLEQAAERTDTNGSWTDRRPAAILCGGRDVADRLREGIARR
ncbi:hypothetical protein [Alienimonas sp. DA493]|uniref:hypothetical protein n=1 Tax=Alienimonas sp. DA493 TaxID=3373605 RepID=UPI0037553AA3